MSTKHVQVAIYTSYLHIIGGIETFILNFTDLMKSDFEMVVVCPRLPEEVAKRIPVPVIQTQEPISCDTLIMIRMMDPIPKHITYQKSIRMCHAMKSNPSWRILQDCDKVVHVSKASKTSFQSSGEVIYNPLGYSEKKALLLVSATRIPALDKGKNAERMLKLAKMLNDKEIPFLWFNFSDAPLQNAPKGFVNVGHFAELQPYIKRADYLVQLSDHEGFGYSVLEALMVGTAVICTPFETTKELGVIDGKNGYIIPFDLNFDVEKLLKVPEFSYTYDNDKIKTKWTKLLKSKPKPKSKTHSPHDLVMVRVSMSYHDLHLNRYLNRNQCVQMTRERAEYLANYKPSPLVTILEE